MRTNLFVSTLFALSLVSVAALAEKPHDGTQGKGPRALENLRSHGDMVDKTYRGADKAPGNASSQASTTSRTSQTKTSIDKGASRVNCSESGADCSASSRAAGNSANGLEAGASQHGYAVRAPAFLDKILGNDRTNFNEAGEDEGMSGRAVKRAWSHSSGSVGGRGAAGTATLLLAGQKQNVRGQEQASSDRMSCNDADECMMSSKAVKKSWAYTSIKAGTWSGPEPVQPSNAERAIAEQKAGAGKTATRAADHASHAQAVQHENDHQH